MSDATEMMFVVDIFRPEGSHERIEAAGPRLLVGSAPHCDVRLQSADVEREHVILELDGAKVLARAMPAAVPARLSGLPFELREVGPSNRIAVCGTTLVVRAVPRTTRPTRSATRRVFEWVGLVALILALPAAIGLASVRAEEPALAPAPPSVALFDHAVAACKTADPAQARHVAKQLRERAESHRERHHFDMADGPLSVSAFREASACHRTGAQPEEAALDAASADALAADLEQTYRVHRVRLEHALEIGSVAVAMREVRALRRLLWGKTGPYVDWLAVVERRLELAMEPRVKDDAHL